MGLFKYEDCLLKHYIRTNAWLPACRRRLETIRKETKSKTKRRLRYFTFCAVGAVDVLMLDVAKIITRSNSGKFDTVIYFDKNRDSVVETQKRIPGAVGFPGDFIKTILKEDLKDEMIREGYDPLLSPDSEVDVAKTRALQIRAAEHLEFIKRFPFDVINLDLEEFLFKPKEELPGKVVNALRKMFSWQQRPIIIRGSKPHYLSGFSLMFTTQIGPPNLSEDYLDILRQKLYTNIENDHGLNSLLLKRTGTDNLYKIESDYFDVFFKLAVPKVVGAILMEEDWYIDSDSGVQLFEIERSSHDGPYKMLHLVMDIKRKNPPKEKRVPGQDSPDALKAYHKVVRQIIANKEIVVTEDFIDKVKLQNNLDRIKARRKKYCPDE